MENKLKIISGVFIGFCIMLGGSIGVTYIGYQGVERMYYEQVMGIVGKVVEQNPESEVLVAQSLKTLDPQDIARGKEILKPYGYEADALGTRYLNRGFEKLLKINLFMTISVFVAIVAVGYSLYRRLKKRLDYLQSYLMHMAQGQYHLNIKGIGEGKFSLFEDQIYKTTLALRESKEEQEKEKLDLAKNIADLSHQLKTPLTSMSIMTDLLLENEQDEQNKQFVWQLNGQIERLSKLVGVLLKLAKFDAGTIKLKQQEIVVSSFIEEMLDMLEIPIGRKHITVHVEGGQDVCLKGDKNWTYEAIHNILYNCVQHSPEGGRITIEWSHNPIYTEIVIQDQGGGVPLDDLPHIFTRFYKGKNASKESVGIGLAMAKTIIEKQSGEIKVKNREGGARFQMRFY